MLMEQTIDMTQGPPKEGSRHEKLINEANGFFYNTVKKLSPQSKKHCQVIKIHRLINLQLMFVLTVPVQQQFKSNANKAFSNKNAILEFAIGESTPPNKI